MSNVETRLAPPHSIIFVADPTSPYEVAEDTGSALVTATSSCIGIGTLAESDGETTVRLGTDLVTPEMPLVFEGTLETPGFRVAVVDSGAKQILSVQVPNDRSRVRVWANDASEPNVIFIEVR